MEFSARVDKLVVLNVSNVWGELLDGMAYIISCFYEVTSNICYHMSKNVREHVFYITVFL